MCFQLGLNAQSPADWWYFGQKAGVHFTSNGPVADTNGVLNTFEGCASISSATGDLLFYTDGTWVFDANHDTMPNGDSLLGNSSSTQSAIIIPVPNNSQKYYVVTVSTSPFIGLNYSVVDMTQNGGFGDVLVSQKNLFIRTQIREKALAVRHSNNTDYWLITAPNFSDSILAYLVTSSGINTNPIVSITGDTVPNVTSYLKANIEGNMLVNTHETSGRVQLLKFNNSNGQISESLYWDQSPPYSAYGPSFLPMVRCYIWPLGLSRVRSNNTTLVFLIRPRYIPVKL